MSEALTNLLLSQLSYVGFTSFKCNIFSPADSLLRTAAARPFPPAKSLVGRTDRLQCLGRRLRARTHFLHALGKGCDLLLQAALLRQCARALGVFRETLRYAQQVGESVGMNFPVVGGESRLLKLVPLF